MQLLVQVLLWLKITPLYIESNTLILISNSIPEKKTQRFINLSTDLNVFNEDTVTLARENAALWTVVTKNSHLTGLCGH